MDLSFSIALTGLALFLPGDTSGAASDVNAKPPSRVEAGFASPREAFDAMRKARNARDWKGVFLCLTPSAQDKKVVNTFHECVVRCSTAKTNGDLLAILTRHGFDNDNVDREYRARYRKKHGVDLPRDYGRFISEK